MPINTFWSEPEWVSAAIIQGRFNECQYYERTIRGDLKQRVFGYDNHLKPRQRQKIDEPKCTRSQIVLYSDLDGQPVALVHQYRRRDGTLGGTGSPDPNRLFLSGKVIAVRQSY